MHVPIQIWLLINIERQFHSTVNCTELASKINDENDSE